jgi:protein-disulfide isomerase
MKTVLMLAMAATVLPAQDRWVEGNPASSVRVVIWEDLESPDCAAFRAMMDQTLLPRFQSTVAFEHRDFPLSKHPWARKAAIATRYFESINPAVALEFRRTTLANFREIPQERFDDHVQTFARAHQIDPAKALAALSDPALVAAVEKDYQEGVARGIAYTPTVFMNSEPFIEHFAVQDVIKSIERELQSSRLQ